MFLNNFVINFWALLFISFYSSVYLEIVVLPSNVSETNPTVLNCQLSSTDSSLSSVIWEYTNSQNVKTILSVTALTLSITSIKNVGIYICKDENKLVKNFTVAYLATPVIQNGTSLTLIESSTNQHILCTCVQCYPSTTMQWFHEVEVRSNDYELLPSSKFPFINVSHKYDSSATSFALLIFKTVVRIKHANYKCVAANIAGNKSDLIELRVRSKYAALWPFLGILGEVILLVFIIGGNEYQIRKNKVSAKVKEQNMKITSKKNLDELQSSLNDQGAEEFKFV